MPGSRLETRKTSRCQRSPSTIGRWVSDHRLRPCVSGAYPRRGEACLALLGADALPRVRLKWMSSGFHFSPRPNRAHEINWQPWAPEAFERARAEDKPILLSI